MDVERIIDDIEQLEEIFEAADTRPFSATDISAANRRPMKCWRIALGLSSGNITASAADLNLR